MIQALTAVVLRLARRELCSAQQNLSFAQAYASWEDSPNGLLMEQREFHRSRLPWLRLDLKFWEESIAELESGVAAQRAEETAVAP